MCLCVGVGVGGVWDGCFPSLSVATHTRLHTYAPSHLISTHSVHPCLHAYLFHTHGWMDGHAMHLCSKVDSVGPLQLRRLAHKTDGSVCTGASTTQPPCLVSPTPRTQKTHPSIHAFTTTNETNHTD
mmetsp:Transcript_23452/g.67400  ORF Transcript_23452/g.67400 Transcript_23452/m.67400 type:complete len:127 (-) Transcript_23452:947-1327(-)